jgi:hypothetical protein
MSVGTGDSGALLSAVGSSLWDANTLSSAEKQLVEALEVATRNLKAADTIIHVKYLK